MALLNTAENRPSVVITILRCLARERDAKSPTQTVLDRIAPAGISKNQADARASLNAAVMLRLVERDKDELRIASPDAVAAIRKGNAGTIALLRNAVLASTVNTAPWGTQDGARDLTNALSWFLTLPADEAPATMEGAAPSVKELQTRDFGPRQPTRRGQSDEDDEGGGWPLGNNSRWQAFKRWACSLGFAWADPSGRLVPDPTPAVRTALPVVFADAGLLSARDFIDRLGATIPVLDSGPFRQFVEDNWKRPAPEQRRMTSPLNDALERLQAEGLIRVEDQADAARKVIRHDGTTISHIRRVAS